MAAIDFPASPINGQIFAAANGVVYRYLTPPGIWSVGNVGDTAFVGDTPPATPATNQLWFSSTLGQLYIWYNDGNTTQWVPCNPSVSQVLPGSLQLYSEQVLTADGADLRVSVPVGAKKIVIDFLTQPVAATDSFGMIELLAGVPQGGSNHTQVFTYGITPGNTMSVGNQVAQPSWFGFGGVASAWGKIELMNPTITGFNTHGTAQIQFNQAANNELYTAGFWGGVAGANGYRIFFTGNTKAGSYMRSYVVT